MENASKALIIAGAILIAILLISVGILVMNSVNKPLNQATKQGDSQAVQMFNQKFANYAGTKKTAQDIKSLITTVISNNGANKSHIVFLRVKKLDKSGTPSVWKWAVGDRTIASTLQGESTNTVETESYVMNLLDDSKTYSVKLLYVSLNDLNQKVVNLTNDSTTPATTTTANLNLSIVSEPGYIGVIEIVGE